MRRPGPEQAGPEDGGGGRVGRRGVVVPVALLAGLSIALQVAMQATAVQDDPFDSPLYWWTWLIFPLAAALASVWRPSALNPLWFTAAVVVPMLVGTFLTGAVFYDGSGGASFWPVSEVINLVQGLLILVLAYLGALVGHLLRRRRKAADRSTRP